MLMRFISLIKRFYSVKDKRGLVPALQSTLEFILTVPGRIFLQVIFRSRVIRNSSMSIVVLRAAFRIRNTVLPFFSDADPLKLIYVDPSDIRYHYQEAPRQFGKVKAGDWDKTAEKFDSTVKYDQSLAEKIKQNGYLTQRDLFNKNANRVWNENNDAIHPYLNEISINIARDGQMGKVSSGGHRLSVAKELGLDEVPVVVRARHRSWQKIRDRVRAADSTNDLPQSIAKHLDHPDLQDLQNSG